MGTLRTVALVVTCLSSLAIGKLGQPGGPLKMPRQSVDSFRAISKFEHAVAISDSNNDTIFECLASKRTYFDQEAQRATYTFLLPTSGMELSFDMKPGDEPGTVIFTSDGGLISKDAVIYYTNYENCAVADLELQGEGHQCTLWSRQEVKDNVPQDCIDHFIDVCGVVVPAHSRDLCPDDEGDY